MVKKSIAATLLVVLVAWAEMALAPMLAMHFWHVHPASEMSENKATHHNVMPAGHSCCPRISKPESMAALEFAAGSLPCEYQHRCCLLQGPQSVPAPVSAKQGISQAIAPVEIREISPALARSRVSPATAIAPGPPPGLLGMILRI